MKYLVGFLILISLSSCSKQLTQSQGIAKYCTPCKTINDSISITYNANVDSLISLCDSLIITAKITDSLKAVRYNREIVELKKQISSTDKAYFVLDSICKTFHKNKNKDENPPIIKTIIKTITVLDKNQVNFLNDSIIRLHVQFKSSLDSCAKDKIDSVNATTKQLVHSSIWKNSFFIVGLFEFLIILLLMFLTRRRTI